MLHRCTDRGWVGFADYGGRGITVCDRWLKSIEKFIADIGPRPSLRHSLERIDVNGNYEPGNVLWATAKQQGNNRRNTRFLTAYGVTKPISEWACITGLYPNTIAQRVKRGISPEVALGNECAVLIKHQDGISA